jgi:hypothetical protein
MWLSLALLGLATAHPMHTAVIELVADDRGGTAVSIRVYADDLAAAAGPPDVGAAADSAIAGYVRRGVTITDRRGHALDLHWDGAEPAGDAVVLRLHAAAPAGLAGARVAAGLLAERFPDQVNIVRASYSGSTRTLLFTRGEAAKALP